MTRLLLGKEISGEMTPGLSERSDNLSKRDVTPTLALVRVGARDDDLAYERSVMKRSESVGVTVRSVVLDGEATQDEIISELKKLAVDDKVHGILIFLPLPKRLNKRAVLAAIPPEKDVDGVSEASLAALYEGRTMVTPENPFAPFAPCTAASVIVMLDHYGIDPDGKTAVVIGRSMVIGKPVSMMLLDRNASVFICHSKTKQLADKARRAEILIVCAGIARKGPGTGITEEYLSEGQTVIDVAIHADAEGRLYGDVDADAAMKSAANYTPVPGGVGGITTLVLLEHTIRAAENAVNGH
jgi:methylenetetrahydrofolate dehydrogenase (NADP+)/methenyltetrahydrofolate cyclohydrolase